MENFLTSWLSCCCSRQRNDLLQTDMLRQDNIQRNRNEILEENRQEQQRLQEENIQEGQQILDEMPELIEENLASNTELVIRNNSHIIINNTTSTQVSINSDNSTMLPIGIEHLSSTINNFDENNQYRLFISMSKINNIFYRRELIKCSEIIYKSNLKTSNMKIFYDELNKIVLKKNINKKNKDFRRKVFLATFALCSTAIVYIYIKNDDNSFRINNKKNLILLTKETYKIALLNKK